MRRVACLGRAVLIIAIVESGATQEVSKPRDLFQVRVPTLELKDQSVVDGAAILSEITGLPVAVEFRLGATISAPAPAVKVLTASIPSATVSEMLDRLCILDPTFAWSKNGNVANLVPRELREDPNYLLNRRIAQLEFRRVQSAQEAVFSIAEQLPGTKEQIAVLNSGEPLNFDRPWSEIFKGTTVRELLDLIAQRIGPTYGWQFGGAKNFRVITFHARLLPKPSRTAEKHDPSR